MSFNYFNIERSGDFDNISEIILADAEPKRFTRRRTYTPYRLDNANVISAFDKKTRYGETAYFKPLIAFASAFLVLVALSIWFAVNAEDGKVADFTAVYVTAGVFGIGFFVCLAGHFAEYTFVKSRDELYIVYARDGSPCSVEFRGKRARVLYNGALYTVQNGSVKKPRSKQEIYLAHLGMYPASAFDFKSFASGAETDTEYNLVPAVEYLQDGTCVLAFGERGRKMYLEGHTSGSFHTAYTFRQTRDLHFCRFMFVVDSDLKLRAIYSAVRDGFFAGSEVMTLAEVADRGQPALDSLWRAVGANKPLENLLNGILL